MVGGWVAVAVVLLAWPGLVRCWCVRPTLLGRAVLVRAPPPYGAPGQVHSDEDVSIRSDTGWYKRVVNALNVEVTTGVP